VLDNQLRVRSANEAFFEEFKVTERETVGRPFLELQACRWGLPDLKQVFEGLLAEGDVEKREYKYPGSGGREGGVRMTAYRVAAEGDRPIMILLTFEKRSDGS
jgi:PAS domain-containing protein